jgi:hypothetical protein
MEGEHLIQFEVKSDANIVNLTKQDIEIRFSFLIIRLGVDKSTELLGKEFPVKLVIEN